MSFDCKESLKIVTDTANSKGAQYRREPVEYMEIDECIIQVKIKATRAKEAIGTEKQIDELKDVAVYAIKTMQRLLNEGTKDTVQTSILDYSTSTTQIHLMEPGEGLL